MRKSERGEKREREREGRNPFSRLLSGVLGWVSEKMQGLLDLVWSGESIRENGERRSGNKIQNEQEAKY